MAIDTQRMNNGQVVDKTPFLDLLSKCEDVTITEIPGTKQRKFLVALTPTAGQPQQNSQSLAHSRDHLMGSAQVLLTNGDFLLARNVYSFLLKDNVRDSSALKGLGLCFYRLGDRSSAKRCFKAVWELFGLEEALVWMALCLVTEKQDVAALGLFAKVKQAHLLPKPLQFDLFREMGNCQMRLGNYLEAEDAYQKALVVEPKSDVVYVNLGMLEVQRGHLHTAQIHFEKAWKINDKNAKAICGLGIVDAENGKYEAAKLKFLNTLELDSQNTIAIYQLASLGDHLNIAGLIQDHITKFLAHDPKSKEIRFLLGSIHFRDGNWSTAETELKHVLTIDPGFVPARNLLDELRSNRHPR